MIKKYIQPLQLIQLSSMAACWRGQVSSDQQGATTTTYYNDKNLYLLIVK